jgi:uncharacterized protein (DUF983 family)
LDNGKPLESRKWHSGGFFGMLWSLVRARCPRCRQGRMFRGSLTMNDPCPVCGLIFQREEGYFLGAMYCSYVLASGLLGIFYYAADALVPNLNGAVLVLIAMVPFLPLVPAVERAGSPGDESAGAYEKLRIRQRDEHDDQAS